MGVQLTGQSMQKPQSNFEFGFFKLENNHDKAIVRLLHENYDDFSRRPVHYVRLPGYRFRRGVNCLRADNDPESVCPLCSCKLSDDQVGKRGKKIYIEFLVYKVLDRNGKIIQDYTESPKRMVWERDRRFDDKIFSLASRYPRLCDVVFQIERFGEAGSTQTQYDIYQIDVDQNQYPYELPEKVYNPDGIQVLDKTADEMYYYIENGDFPPTDNGSGKVERRADVQQPVQTQQQYQQPQYQQSVQNNQGGYQQSYQTQYQQPQPPQQSANVEVVPDEQFNQQPVQPTTSRRRSI